MLSTESVDVLLNGSESKSNIDVMCSTELFQSMSFESLLFALLRIIKDKKYGIRLENNSLLIPASHSTIILPLINNIIETLCQISVTFEFDEVNDTYNVDFNNLSSEIDILS